MAFHPINRDTAYLLPPSVQEGLPEAHLARYVAIIDWASRKVLSWRISNSREAVFCVDCLEDALRHHGKPALFNSDQGAQFTRAAFTGVLTRNGIALGRDGRGRAFDIFVERLWRSVKHEDVYLKGYASMGELMLGLTEYFAFTNGERPHQSLGHKTPDVVYQTGIGGGATVSPYAQDRQHLHRRARYA
jgi:putative transposase